MTVKTGQLIAREMDLFPVTFMPPFREKLSRIEEVPDVSGYAQAVFIDVSGDEWVESINRDNSLDKEIQ